MTLAQSFPSTLMRISSQCFLSLTFGLVPVQGMWHVSDFRVCKFHSGKIPIALFGLSSQELGEHCFLSMSVYTRQPSLA